MQFREWDEIPEFMKNEDVKKYYEILRKKRFSLKVKRFFDVTASFVLILLLSPVFLILSVWIKTDSKGPVYFKQERVTQYGRKFSIFKFRTMVINADRTGSLVTVQNDSRITVVGRKIRKYRLDEVPQLFNILAGDMSFVGTRPEVQKYVDEYSDEMKATLLLPAGVTSEASIRYKDEDELLKDAVDVDEVYIQKILPEKMRWNLRAIRRFSLPGELSTMVRTVFHVMD
jgi:lipopolysaccharide/colanic/teichoic acid biosynthesis glycosyltransferase